MCLAAVAIDSGSNSKDADERRDAQDTGSYEHALERTRDWPDDWERPENDERALPAIVRAFRTASPASAQETLAQRIEAGLGVETADVLLHSAAEELDVLRQIADVAAELRRVPLT